MGLREDIAAVNRLYKAYANREDKSSSSGISDFFFAARDLFRDSGDSIEMFVDMALTVKRTPEENDQEEG